ncbi:tyrosine-protein kinase ABL2 isoform X1 [Tachysurus ichikawai]
MGQQVGRVGDGASAALQSPPHGHSQQPHQSRGSRGSSSGRRPREATSAGTPACRLAVTANASDPGINIFTQHSVMAAHTASLELSEAASINVQVVIRSDCDGRE